MNELFAKSIHGTTTSFNFSEHPSWVAFFNEPTRAWNVSPPRHIGRILLDNVNVKTISSVVNVIRKSGVGVLGIDSATNRLAKSVSNMIIHNHNPLFLECLWPDLKRETFANVMAKITDVLTRLEKTGIPNTGFSFVSDCCNCMHDVRRTLLEQKLDF